jgi:hypothetical protein
VNDDEPAGIACSYFLQGAETAVDPFDRDDFARAGCEQRAGEASRSRSHLDDRDAVELPSGAGDAQGEIEIEEEVLPKALDR